MPLITAIASSAEHQLLHAQVESRAALQLGPAIITLKGKVARSFLLLMRIPSWIRSLLAFKAQQIMLASTMTKITAVFVIGIPLCFLGGILYSWTSGKGLIDGFINAYGALYKIPGKLRADSQVLSAVESARFLPALGGQHS